MALTSSLDKHLRRWQTLRHTITELAMIVLFGLLYNAAMLAGSGPDRLALHGLDPNQRISGIEHERLAGILIPVQFGLGLSERAPGIGHLPAWNPYLGTGTPLINNAFFYLFNPFMSLPVLLLGAVQGTKLATSLSLLLAGVNMWALARVIGLGRAARVLTGALYLMSGGIMGKFFSGHFQLGLSLVWLPLVFAGLWWTLHSRSRLAPVLMAVAFALLFFSGNIYYTLHALVCCAVMAGVYMVEHWGKYPESLTHQPPLHAMEGGSRAVRDGDEAQNPTNPQPDRNAPSGERSAPSPAWLALRRLAFGGALAFGLTMIQFLPVWSVRAFVNHETVDFDPHTGQLVEQYDAGVSLSNLILPREAWYRLQDPPVNLMTAVDYAYIGPTPFLLIAGLIFTGLNRYRRIVIIAFVLALLMMVWGAGQAWIVSELYRRVPLLAEFRYIGRAHAVAGLWWIVLAGVALDHLWRAFHQPEWAAYDRARLLRVLVLAVLVWGWLLVYSTANNSTRLNLALGHAGLFNTLNNLRFVHYPQALGVLIELAAAALLIDTLLIPLDLRLRRKINSLRVIWPVIRMRLARVSLLLLALVAIADALSVNHPLIKYEPPGNNFGSLYAHMLATVDHITPFPSVMEPFNPTTFDVYSSRIRTWGLNEGWMPRPVRGDLIPVNSPKLLHLPGWAIVSTEFQRGATYELARAFAERHGGVLELCVSESTLPAGADPCDIEQYPGSILYRLPQALPYAFVAAETTLMAEADRITAETARPVVSVFHQMDTITIQAAAPEDGEQYYLIVQETHFPGWQAEIDGAPVQTFTVGARSPDGASAGYIGVPMQPGAHRYTLRFVPPGFGAGLFISGLTLLVMVLSVSGIRLPGRTANQKGRGEPHPSSVTISE